MDDDRVIQEFQRREAEFKRRSQLNFLTLALPAFALFGVGIMTNRQAIAMPSFVVFGAAIARVIYFLWKYRRCPACERVLWPSKRQGSDWCRKCGAALSKAGL